MNIYDIEVGDILVNVDENGAGYFLVKKVNRKTVDVIGENGNHVRAYPCIFNRKVTYPVPAFATS